MDDRRILDLCPLPLARGHRRLLNAREPRERHDAAYYLFEVLLKYLASVAVAGYLSSEEREHRVNAALKGLARPSLGEWLGFLRECARFSREKKDSPPAARAVADFFERKEGPGTEAVQLFNALRSFLAGKPSQKESVSVEMLLAEVVAYRNRVLGHGAPQKPETYERFGEAFAGAFRELLDRAPFLTACRLVAFDSIQVEGGSRVECGVVEFMGVNPLRKAEPHVLAYGASPPRKGSLYLLGAEGELLLLDPLLVARDEDVYFLNEAALPAGGAGMGASAGAPEYLSYSSGERYRPADLDEAEKDLFRRILGYEVDEALISRLGEDLEPAARAEPSGETVQRRLGDYRVVREIGRGAMGIVFEAVQESLGRRVALKVLPGNFALDPRRVERFRREARATARIHHPNIVPVYEVGEADGNHFYAMEYVDGRPLDRLLAGAREEPAGARKPGSSTASDPTYIARGVEQVAALSEGLAEAHRLGLVHRDVKPSNVLVDRSGRYVLVDFGLVREEEAETLTRSGEMVGTLSYMSPEQVSRRPVDARSDVYSLGATLYEVLTLRAPFAGKSDHEIQNAILFEEPAPPRKLNPRLHRDIETIIIHAIEKNPDRRYASAAELAADLRRFLRYEPVHARPQTAIRRLIRRAGRQKARLGAAAAIVVLSAVAGWFAWKASRPPRYHLTPPGQVTFDLDALTTEPALSHDGKLLAYASDRGGKNNLDIWVQTLEGDDPRQITSHEADDREPDFSPDGRTIAFRSGRDGGGIYVVPASGGEERRLAEKGRRPRFSPDGQWIAYSSDNDRNFAKSYVLPAAGGEPRRLRPEFQCVASPAWLPDGQGLAFWGYRPTKVTFIADTGAEIWIAPLEGGEAMGTGRILSHDPGRWTADRGPLIAEDSSDLWAISIEGSPPRARRPFQRLTSGTGLSRHASLAGGRVAFAGLASHQGLWALPLTGSDGSAGPRLELLTRTTASCTSPSLSADGRKLAFRSSRTLGLEVRLKDLETGAETLVARPGGVVYWPLLSRAGLQVAYAVQEKAGFVIHTIPVEGGEPRVVARDVVPSDWAPDEKGLLCFFREPEARRFVGGEVRLPSGERRKLLEHPGRDVLVPRFSRDGRWVAFVVADLGGGGHSQVFVASYAEGRAADPKEWISVSDGVADDKPHWSSDGQHIYFTSDRDGSTCIYAQRLDAVTRQPVSGGLEEVHHFHSARLSPRNVWVQVRSLAVGPDKLVLDLGELTGSIWMAELRVD